MSQLLPIFALIFFVFALSTIIVLISVFSILQKLQNKTTIFERRLDAVDSVLTENYNPSCYPNPVRPVVSTVHFRETFEQKFKKV